MSEAGEARAFSAVYFGNEDGVPSTPFSLIAALGIDQDALSDKATAALEAIEEMAREADDSDWSHFKWKLSAFSAIQDIFDAPLMPPVDVPILFEQYYFYFESRMILAESVLAGLNGLYAASSALLRPFLEFSLLQNYYHRQVNAARSYKALIEYFETRRPPSWNTVMKKALPDSKFAKPIRYRAQAHLTALSQSSSHPYHPESSPVQHRTAVGAHSLVGLFFWHSTSAILESALWVYYVNFPLLFNRVDVLRKFGYNEPIGVAVHGNTVELVRRSLSQADFPAFQEYASSDETAQTVRQWIAARPDLTDDEIRSTWSDEDGPLTNLWHGYCQHMSKLRALRAAMAFRLSDRSDPPELLIESMKTLEGWTRLSRLKSRRE